MQQIFMYKQLKTFGDTETEKEIMAIKVFISFALFFFSYERCRCRFWDLRRFPLVKKIYKYFNGYLYDDYHKFKQLHIALPNN